MTKARKITKAEIFSTGTLKWWWRVSYESFESDAKKGISNESAGNCFTKRGATRKVKKLLKEVEIIDKTYHVVT